MESPVAARYSSLDSDPDSRKDIQDEYLSLLGHNMDPTPGGIMIGSEVWEKGWINDGLPSPLPTKKMQC